MLADRDVYIHTRTRVKHYVCVYIPCWCCMMLVFLELVAFECLRLKIVKVREGP